MMRMLRVGDADPTMIAEVKRIFDQVGEIQYMRDRIAHNAAYPNFTDKEGWFSTTNHYTAHEGDKISLVMFKPTMLLNMVRDLEAIPPLLERALDPPFTLASMRRPTCRSQNCRPICKTFAGHGTINLLS